MLSKIVAAPRTKQTITYRYTIQIADLGLSVLRDEPSVVSQQLGEICISCLDVLNTVALTRGYSPQASLGRHAKGFLRHFQTCISHCPELCKSNAVDFVTIIQPFCELGMTSNGLG